MSRAIPTYIHLDRMEYRRAQVRALEQGISFAEYLARLVRADLGQRSDLTDVVKPKEQSDAR